MVNAFFSQIPRRWRVRRCYQGTVNLWLSEMRVKLHQIQALLAPFEVSGWDLWIPIHWHQCTTRTFKHTSVECKTVRLCFSLHSASNHSLTDIVNTTSGSHEPLPKLLIRSHHDLLGSDESFREKISSKLIGKHLRKAGTPDFSMCHGLRC